MAEKIDPSDPANGEVLKVMMAMEIAKIKQSSPGLVAKQVHAELVKDARFTNISVSEVKRACSKIAKAEVAAGGRTLTPQEAAGTAGAAMITNEQADAMVKGDAATAAETAGATLARIQNDQAVDSQLAMLSMLADCSVGGAITRDPGQYVAEVPGLAANRTTLTRGDRLGTAAQRGDTQQVKKLVSKGADPNFRNAASGVTPLGVASERGHVDVVKVLLKARADVEAQTLEGFRPLHIAAQFGQEAVVRELIGARADVHSRCPLQARARAMIGRAILRNSPRNSDARIHSHRGAQDTFPLMLATHFDSPPTMRALLDAGASANFCSERGFVSLHSCCSAASVRMLLDAKADTAAAANVQRETPLHTLAAAGWTAAVKELLAGGADAALLDAKGQTPLQLAKTTLAGAGAPGKATLELLGNHELKALGYGESGADGQSSSSGGALALDYGDGGDGGDDGDGADGGGGSGDPIVSLPAHTPGGGGYQDLALGGGLNLTDLQRLFGQGTSHVGPEYYASRR